MPTFPLSDNGVPSVEPNNGSVVLLAGTSHNTDPSGDKYVKSLIPQDAYIYRLPFRRHMYDSHHIWQLSRKLLKTGISGGRGLETCHQFSSVQFSCSVVSDSLPPHESQHARPPCPSPTPGVYSDSRPSSQ